MAEKTGKLTEMSTEEKLETAKELYANGTRSYMLKNYKEATDDLSQASGLYADIYGEDSDEIAMPYLLYGKALTQLMLTDNKVYYASDEGEVSDEADDEDDDGDDDEEAEEEGQDDGDQSHKDTESDSKINGENGEKLENDDDKEQNIEEAKTDNNINEISNNDETSENAEDKEEIANSSTTVNEKPEIEFSKTKTDDCQPSSSTGITEKPSIDEDTGNGSDQDDNETNNVNRASVKVNDLQVAWEILEIAASIFRKQGEKGLANLADAHETLGEISLENEQFYTAINDYQMAYDLQKKIPDNNTRTIAELQFKIGLCYTMLNDFKTALVSYRLTLDLINAEIERQRSLKRTELTTSVIAEMEGIKEEVSLKIADIEELDKEQYQAIRNEVAKIYESMETNGHDLNIPSTSSSSSLYSTVPSSTLRTTEELTTNGITNSNEAKPRDITHLIKRKRPDSSTTINDDDQTPAKRPHTDN